LSDNSVRDMIGYGESPLNPQWPRNARIALQFVLNYEEGGENCVLDGDKGPETFLSEIANAQSLPGQRHMSMESLFEYGSRAGVWRILRLFEEFGLPLTVFAVAQALQKNPDLAKSLVASGHEVSGHGYKWIDYQNIPESVEREHIAKTIEIIRSLCGERPLGWYTGRTSPNTNRLITEEGGFLYSADDYSDDLPFWSDVYTKPQLVVPYTLDANDMRFASPQGFSHGDHFFSYLKDSFDTLYEEGKTSPKMMSVGLHCRIIGRPGRTASLRRFLEYVQSHDHVWVCRRIDIARHWQSTHPYSGGNK